MWMLLGTEVVLWSFALLHLLVLNPQNLHYNPMDVLLSLVRL